MTGTLSLPGLDVEADERTVFLATAVVTLEVAVVWAYLVATRATITEPRYIVYSWLWIDAGLLAALRVEPSAGNRRHRVLGIAVAATYFLLVMYVPGNVGFTGDGSGITGLRIGWAIPAWGPIVAYNSSLLRLYLLPFEVVGYASLAYLVYANALDAARAALPGVLGLVTCVGCTVPVIAGVAGLLGGSGLVAAAYSWSYDLGTLVFLVTLGTLYALARR